MTEREARSDERRRVEADYLLSEEHKQARKNLFNRSTMLFIPLQWWAIVIAAIGVAALIQG